ncbi:MAG TPA: family 1 glycosylhydrolase [Candidatus Hydrogenedentes bacterium]|nr:family 1 glycosylhydrolase [Candidatus Hydrogenedentota bacterium]
MKHRRTQEPQEGPKLPEGFLLGGTVGAHQTEGGDFHSDWWRWEQRPKRIADGSTSETAADHWNRHGADFALARKLGLNAVFVSLSWARVCPEPDTVDAAALAHYAEGFAGMRALGLTPVAALHEVAAPRWFAEEGGWAAPRAAARFETYARAALGALAPLCRDWIPVVEPEHWITRSQAEGAWPGRARGSRAPETIRRHLAAAHGAAARILRALRPDARVGVSVRAFEVDPWDPDSPWDWQAADRLRHRLNHAFFEAAAREEGGTPDFIAFSWGGSVRAGFSPLAARFSHAKVARDGAGFSLCLEDAPADADGFERALVAMSSHGVPVLVTGLPDAGEDDRVRCAQLRDHLERILRRTAEEPPLAVEGFFPQPLLDGFAWEKGFATGGGLLHVNRDTMARTPNTTAYFLGDIAEHGEIRPGTAARYCGGEMRG